MTKPCQHADVMLQLSLARIQRSILKSPCPPDCADHQRETAGAATDMG